MHKYIHLLEAYRASDKYQSLEVDANTLALETTTSEVDDDIKWVQTYRFPSPCQLSKLSSKKCRKVVTQFYKNIILPRRILLTYLYTDRRQRTMEDICTFMSPENPSRFFDKRKNIWGCTKLKKIMQNLDFGFRVQIQNNAVAALGLPLVMKPSKLLTEESSLIQYGREVKRSTPSEAEIIRHANAIMSLFSNVGNSQEKWDPACVEFKIYLDQNGLRDNLELMNSLIEHFSDKHDIILRPRIICN